MATAGTVWLAARRRGRKWGGVEGQLCASPLHKCHSQALGYRTGTVGKVLYKAIPSLDYYTGQTFNYFNDQFLMGKALSLYFCKVTRLAGIPPRAGKEENTRQEFAEEGGNTVFVQGCRFSGFYKVVY